MIYYWAIRIIRLGLSLLNRIFFCVARIIERINDVSIALYSLYLLLTILVIISLIWVNNSKQKILISNNSSLV